MKPRVILHIDMDAFFASVEQRDHPKLRGKPVIVGGQSRRGVVAAASYEARRFGVRSAMSMVEATRRCPEAIVVTPQMGAYAEASEAVFSIFARYTPLIEGISLDEAFLDMTASVAPLSDAAPLEAEPTIQRSDPVSVAKAIKDAIFRETSLRASAGVAPNKFVAKIASALDKPDGLVVVAPEGARALLAPLPIERMWGVGKKSVPRLRALGFLTLGDLAEGEPARLQRAFGQRWMLIRDRARGLDERPVVPSRQAKSLSAEITFEHDRHSAKELLPTILELSARVSARLTRAGMRGRCVTLKLKSSQHQNQTRRMTLPHAISDSISIAEAARALLPRFESIERGVRLVGVGMSDLSHCAQQELFADPTRAKREKIEALKLNLRQRFGEGAIVTKHPSRA